MLAPSREALAAKSVTDTADRGTDEIADVPAGASWTMIGAAALENGRTKSAQSSAKTIGSSGGFRTLAIDAPVPRGIVYTGVAVMETRVFAIEPFP